MHKHVGCDLGMRAFGEDAAGDCASGKEQTSSEGAEIGHGGEANGAGGDLADGEVQPAFQIPRNEACGSRARWAKQELGNGGRGWCGF